jgi:hypothetical protein
LHVQFVPIEATGDWDTAAYALEKLKSGTRKLWAEEVVLCRREGYRWPAWKGLPTEPAGILLGCGVVGDDATDGPGDNANDDDIIQPAPSEKSIRREARCLHAVALENEHVVCQLQD